MSDNTILDDLQPKEDNLPKANGEIKSFYITDNGCPLNLIWEFKTELSDNHKNITYMFRRTKSNNDNTNSASKYRMSFLLCFIDENNNIYVNLGNEKGTYIKLNDLLENLKDASVNTVREYLKLYPNNETNVNYENDYQFYDNSIVTTNNIIHCEHYNNNNDSYTTTINRVCIIGIIADLPKNLYIGLSGEKFGNEYYELANKSIRICIHKLKIADFGIIANSITLSSSSNQYTEPNNDKVYDVILYKDDKSKDLDKMRYKVTIGYNQSDDKPDWSDTSYINNYLPLSNYVVYFKSSNPEVATIDAYGSLTINGIGDTTISCALLKPNTDVTNNTDLENVHNYLCITNTSICIRQGLTRYEITGYSRAFEENFESVNTDTISVDYITYNKDENKYNQINHSVTLNHNIDFIYSYKSDKRPTSSNYTKGSKPVAWLEISNASDEDKNNIKFNLTSDFTYDINANSYCGCFDKYNTYYSTLNYITSHPNIYLINFKAYVLATEYYPSGAYNKYYKSITVTKSIYVMDTSNMNLSLHKYDTVISKYDSNMKLLFKLNNIPYNILMANHNWKYNADITIKLKALIVKNENSDNISGNFIFSDNEIDADIDIDNSGIIYISFIPNSFKFSDNPIGPGTKYSINARLTQLKLKNTEKPVDINSLNSTYNTMTNETDFPNRLMTYSKLTYRNIGCIFHSDYCIDKIARDKDSTTDVSIAETLARSFVGDNKLTDDAKKFLNVRINGDRKLNFIFFDAYANLNNNPVIEPLNWKLNFDNVKINKDGEMGALERSYCVVEIFEYHQEQNENISYINNLLTTKFESPSDNYNSFLDPIVASGGNPYVVDLSKINSVYAEPITTESNDTYYHYDKTDININKDLYINFYIETVDANGNLVYGKSDNGAFSTYGIYDKSRQSLRIRYLPLDPIDDIYISKDGNGEYYTDINATEMPNILFNKDLYIKIAHNKAYITNRYRKSIGCQDIELKDSSGKIIGYEDRGITTGYCISLYNKLNYDMYNQDKDSLYGYINHYFYDNPNCIINEATGKPIMNGDKSLIGTDSNSNIGYELIAHYNSTNKTVDEHQKTNIDISLGNILPMLYYNISIRPCYHNDKDGNGLIYRLGPKEDDNNSEGIKYSNTLYFYTRLKKPQIVYPLPGNWLDTDSSHGSLSFAIKLPYDPDYKYLSDKETKLYYLSAEELDSYKALSTDEEKSKYLENSPCKYKYNNLKLNYAYYNNQALKDIGSSEYIKILDDYKSYNTSNERAGNWPHFYYPPESNYYGTENRLIDYHTDLNKSPNNGYTFFKCKAGNNVTGSPWLTIIYSVSVEKYLYNDNTLYDNFDKWSIDSNPVVIYSYGNWLTQKDTIMSISNMFNMYKDNIISYNIIQSLNDILYSIYQTYRPYKNLISTINQNEELVLDSLNNDDVYKFLSHNYYVNNGYAFKDRIIYFSDINSLYSSLIKLTTNYNDLYDECKKLYKMNTSDDINMEKHIKFSEFYNENIENNIKTIIAAEDGHTSYSKSTQVPLCIIDETTGEPKMYNYILYLVQIIDNIMYKREAELLPDIDTDSGDDLFDSN